ncbi:MAG: hypothetical protein FGM52_07860, partial [Mycobacterium sp.]|nr:hypothetical protein [Mycobacterium sp.]
DQPTTPAASAAVAPSASIPPTPIDLIATVPSVREGSPASFQVVMSGPRPTGDIVVNYVIASGTAMVGVDTGPPVLAGKIGAPPAVVSPSGKLTFKGTANVSRIDDNGRFTLSVPTVNDALVEINETFTVSISLEPGSQAVLGQSTQSVVILDDDVPTVSIVPPSPATVAEGGRGTFEVTLSEPNPREAVRVPYTSTGTATYGSDYVLDVPDGFAASAANGVVEIPRGAKTGFIPLITRTDKVSDPNETVTVTLSKPNGATLSPIEALRSATATILDVAAIPGPDPTPIVSPRTVTIEPNNVPVEGDSGKSLSAKVFAVRLSQPALSPVTVTVSTADGVGANAARAGLDYTAITNRQVNFALNSNGLTDTVQFIDVEILGDTVAESSEAFTATLISATGAELGSTRTATAVIRDNDQPAESAAGPAIAPFGTVIDPTSPGRTRFEFRNAQAFAVLLSNGSVRAWGNPATGGTDPTLTGVSQIFSTTSAFAALRVDGTVEAWGAGAAGKAPVGLGGVKQIYSTASAFAALKDDGTVVAWGEGLAGKAPVGLGGVKQIYSTASAFAALTNDNKVFAWGDGAAGNAPQGLTNVADIFATDYAFAALQYNGAVTDTVTVWGDERYGGDKKQVSEIGNIKTIYANRYAFAAVDQWGRVRTWGDKTWGGDVSTAGLGDTPVSKIFATNTAFAALTKDKSVVAWGDAGNGGAIPTAAKGLLGSRVDTVVANSRAFAALKSDGTVVSWGDPLSGGNGAAPAGLTGVKEIVSNSLAFAALKYDGTVTAWGDQTFGGKNDFAGALAKVTRIFSSAGAFAALTESGAVQSWGDPNYGGGFGLVITGSLKAISAADPFRDDRCASCERSFSAPLPTADPYAAAPRVYIASGAIPGQLETINTATNSRSSFGFGTNYGRSGPIALSSDGLRLYSIGEANYRATLFVTSTRRGDTVGTQPPTITVELSSTDRSERFKALAVSPDGRLFITDSGGGYVRVYNPNSFSYESIALTDTFAEPRSVVVSPDGRRAYVGSLDGEGYNFLSALDISNPADYGVKVDIPGGAVWLAKSIATISVGATAMAITPDGLTLYAAGTDPSAGVAVIDTDSMEQVATIALPVPSALDGRGDSDGLRVSPDGARLYAIVGNPTTAVALAAVDTATNTVTNTVPLSVDTRGLAVSPDGRSVWVSSDGRLKRYNPFSLRLEYQTEGLGGFDSSVAVGPGPGLAAYLNAAGTCLSCNEAPVKSYPNGYIPESLEFNPTTGEVFGKVAATDPNFELLGYQGYHIGKDGYDVQEFGGQAGSWATTFTTSKGGKVTINKTTGAFFYLPAQAARQTAGLATATARDQVDTFGVWVYDRTPFGAGGMTVIPVTVPIEPLNMPPRIITAVTTVTDTTPTTGVLTLAVSATDPNNDKLSYSVSTPTKGTVQTVSAPTPGYTQAWSYTPTATARHEAAKYDPATQETLWRAASSEPLTVTVSDGRGGTTSKTYDVAILPSNASPKAGIPSVGVPDAATGTVTGSIAVQDADGDPLTYQLTTPPSSGTAQIVSVSATGVNWSYTPKPEARAAAGPSSTDSFVITANDGYYVGGKTPVTVTVPVSPALPVVSISPVTLSVAEGNSGSKTVSFAVSLSGSPTAGPVSVNWATANGTATAGSDYTAGSGVVSFARGTTALSQNVTVSVTGDTAVEADETFTVNLSSASGATLGAARTATVTITNDDAAALPVVSISPVTLSVAEGNSGSKTVSFAVSLSGSPTAGPVSV